MIAEPPAPEEALRIVVEGTARVVGADYFRALVRELARALGYRFAFVGELLPGPRERVRTLAVWNADRHLDDFIYDLAGTPCENVLGKRICSYPRDVQREFPSDAMLVEIGAACYLGAPLISKADRAVGLIAVLDDVPRTERAHTRWLLRSCADRAAAEFERMGAEAALRASEARYAAAVAGTSDGLWDWDCNGDEIYLADRFRELLGYRGEDELPGTRSAWRALLHPDDRARAENRVERHLVAGEPFDVQYRMRARDGEYRWFRVRGRARRSESGEFERMAGSITDVSELVRATEEREALIDELARKNAELERFMYTVSHELKSPLVTIEGFVGYLREDLDARAPEAVDRDLHHISLAVRRIQQQLDGISSLARLGRIVGELTPLDMTQIVDEACALVAVDARARGLELAVTRPLPAAHGDGVRVLEVVQNLLENAIKFSEEAAPARVEVGGELDGAQARYFVRDFGRGVEPAYRERIFELFEQLDVSVDGSGIGLAVVKRIVEIHGGRIWCESAGRGAGSTFYFTLPAARAGGGEAA
ncbi:MAG: PAS domain-containing protein [Myxococcales bacterium]|nr:PAS domain-containing protein [Myxococcales bacterium]